MPRKITFENFVQKAQEVHGTKYDYSKANYKNITTKIHIICPEHGEFEQYPYVHLKGSGCPVCGKKISGQKHNSTTEKFIKRAKEIHGNKYDYSKVKYKNNTTKVCIICPEHGEFWQSPSNHLQGSGCRKCGIKDIGKARRNSLSDFIEKAIKKHGNKYDYSKVEFNVGTDKVCIICPEHGEFLQSAKNHLNGNGCPKCQGYNKTTEEFIEQASKIHNNKWDYSKLKYEDTETKVCIICPEHGEFWQMPRDHLKGTGCPKCLMSSIEKNIEQFLIDNNIKYEWQKTFPWLIYKKLLKIDFYLPEYNVGIECQGLQHNNDKNSYKRFFGMTKDKWEKVLLRDKLKKKLCLEHNIKILYYSEKNIEFFDKIYTDKNELLKEIKK